VEFSDRAISKKEDRKGSGSDLDVAPGKAVVPQGSFSFLAGASFPFVADQIVCRRRTGFNVPMAAGQRSGTLVKTFDFSGEIPAVQIVPHPLLEQGFLNT
jgi:hypothetical protein